MKEKLFCMLLLAGGMTASLAQADVTRIEFKMFEGSISEWNNGNTWHATTATTTETSYTGAQSLKITCNNAVGGEWQFNEWHAGTSWVNTPYLQLAFKNASSSFAAGTIYLQYWDGNGTNNWVTAGTLTVPTNDSKWYAYSFDMRPNDLYWSTGFRLITYSLGVGTYYLDDIVLNSVPEPASLGLLALGGLALLRRRRA